MTLSTLSAEATYSFQRIYEEEFGERLSKDEANLEGMQLLRFFEILAHHDGDSAKSGDQGGRANSEQKY